MRTETDMPLHELVHAQCQGVTTHQMMSFGACTIQGASMTAPSKRPGVSSHFFTVSFKGPLWLRHLLTSPFFLVWEANHCANPLPSAGHKS